MFSENSKINFLCTSCGKCCSSPPIVNFYEMLELSKEFVFQMAHRTVLSTLKNPIEKLKAQHMEKIAHTIVVPEFDCSIFYYVDFVPILFENEKNCSKLENNLCSIYGKRPISCRISPINTTYAEHEQWIPISTFQKKVSSEKWGCSFSETDPVIFNDKKPIQNLNLYNQSLYSIREITDKYLEFIISQGDEVKNKHLISIFEATQKKSTIYHDIIQALQMGLYHNIIVPNFAKNVVANQILLLEQKMIELNSKHKVSKLQIEQINNLHLYYQKILDNNILSQQENEFGVI